MPTKLGTLVKNYIKSVFNILFSRNICVIDETQSAIFIASIIIKYF